MDVMDLMDGIDGEGVRESTCNWGLGAGLLLAAFGV
jgi:hypothetical protein